MRFGTWNVRSLYRSGSLTTVNRELARYKLDLVGVQEVRWDKEGEVRAGGLYSFSMEKKRKSLIGNKIFVHHRILSAVKRVEFVSDRMLYIVMRGRWCNIIVLNAHAPSEGEKVSKDSFMRKWNEFLIIFQGPMKILLIDFKAKLGKDDIFTPTIWNESLHQDSNDNGARIVNVTT